MNKTAILGALNFIKQAENLKNVIRTSHTSSGRNESTAEHTWRLCLIALVFENEFIGIDFKKLLKICILHDLGEAISGDIPAVAKADHIYKSKKERKDLLILLEPLDDKIKTEFILLWDEYDKGNSIEALLVKGMDKLETIIQHNQGKNPINFDYTFNLTYGEQYTNLHPVLMKIREILNKETKKNIQ